MLSPLLRLSIHALFSTASSEHILPLSNSFSEDTNSSYSCSSLSPSSHSRLSASATSPINVLPTTQAVADDSDLGEVRVVHTESDPTTEKPRYTCPTIIYIFDCNECGGAKHITSAKIIGGMPNASCVGVSNFGHNCAIMNETFRKLISWLISLQMVCGKVAIVITARRRIVRLIHHLLSRSRRNREETIGGGEGEGKGR